MMAATVEASMPATPPSTDIPGRPQDCRVNLRDELTGLRSTLLGIDVSAEDTDRDRQLRAALSTAIGAASSLALASSSQPTAGYLSLTRTAVDGVLSAAGRRTLD
jgi:hypothetical protein